MKLEMTQVSKKRTCLVVTSFKLFFVGALVLLCVGGVKSFVFRDATEVGELPHADVNLSKSKLNSIQHELNELEVCSTAECLKSAEMILSKIDESVDPCDNFYSFACGRYVRETKIPDDQALMMSFMAVHKKVQKQLSNIMIESVNTSESRAFVLAKNFNKACKNLDSIAARGIKPLQDIIESYGGWPVVKGDSWNRSEWNWQRIYGRIYQDGFAVAPILRMEITTDEHNSSAWILDVDQPNFEISREFLLRGLSDPFVRAYHDFMVDAAVIFGANRTRAEKEMNETLEFEQRLASICLAEEERRNLSLMYNPFKISKIQSTYPYIQWLELINSLAEPILTFDANETVVIEVPRYFKDLDNILANTDARVIANYFNWRVVLSSSKFLTNDLRELRRAFETVTSGIKAEMQRDAECAQKTTGRLSIAVGALYVRRYFDENSKRHAVELVNNIRNEFIKLLHDLPWMDETTKLHAIEKTKSMETHIAYPDELLDDKKLDEFYADLDIEADDYFGNMLKVRKFDQINQFKMFREAVNKSDWRTHSQPAMVNAQYSPLENSIQIPAAILQDEFFSADRPQYMNYGAIGQIIGHEISHAFDDQGKQFDVDGNLVNWWQPETEERFLERARCIIEQYGNYTDTLTNLKLNGINTQGENIADNGGSKEAYAAYRQWTEQNGNELTLPGLKYDTRQLFWISAAQTWCSVTRFEFAKMLVTADVHPPNEFRVIGPLSNMIEFANDFNCERNAKMNPLKKCQVW